MDHFRQEDYAHVATLLRTLAHDDGAVRAILSNNFNIILGALDHAAASHNAKVRRVADAVVSGEGLFDAAADLCRPSVASPSRTEREPW